METTFQPEPSPVASTGAGDATPAAPAPSASAPEATQQPDLSANAGMVEQVQQPETSGEDRTPADSEEFPEDIGNLPDVERKTNWQQARARIAELRQQAAELEQYKPVLQQIEELGGFERLQQQADLAGALFTPLVDANGQPFLDPNGLPQYTSEPFLQRLQQESPGTFYELVWKSMQQPVGDETVGHWMMREWLGLDPALLDTYRQIQSPQDAAPYLGTANGLTPDDFAGIPDEYHDAFKSLTPELREEVKLMSDVARDQYLAERAELLETRRFREEQQAWQRQQDAERAEAFKRQIHEAGEKLIEETRAAKVNAQYDKLKAEARFLPDDADNQIVWDEIINHALTTVEKDPALQSDLTRYNQLCLLTAQYNAQGDQWRAAQARIEAERLVTKMDARFRNAVTQRTGWWSKTLGAARNSLQNQVAQSQPRAEIGTANSASSANPQISTAAPQGQRFGLTPGEIQALASNLALRRQGAS